MLLLFWITIRGEIMSTSEIKRNVNKPLAVVISLAATLIVAGVTAVASIQTEIRNAVITAAGFIEVWFILWIIDQF